MKQIKIITAEDRYTQRLKQFGLEYTLGRQGAVDNDGLIHVFTHQSDDDRYVEEIYLPFCTLLKCNDFLLGCIQHLDFSQELAMRFINWVKGKEECPLKPVDVCFLKEKYRKSVTIFKGAALELGFISDGLLDKRAGLEYINGHESFYTTESNGKFIVCTVSNESGKELLDVAIFGKSREKIYEDKRFRYEMLCYLNRYHPEKVESMFKWIEDFQNRKNDPPFTVQQMMDVWLKECEEFIEY